jgi:hypothetical protein
MIDLLWVEIGGVVGAGLGLVGGLRAKRWMRAPRRAKHWAVPSRHAGTMGVVVGAMTLGLVGAALSKPPSLDVELERASPTLAAVHRYYPDAFAQMVVVADGLGPHDGVAMQNRVRPLVAQLVAAHRSELNDDTAAALGQLMLDETQSLEASNPQACVAILTGEPVQADMGLVVSRDLVRRDARVTAKLIEQVATHPASQQGRLTEAESQTLTDRALAKLPNGDQEAVTAMLTQRRQPGTTREAAAFCAFARARVSAALDGPQGVMRRLLVS